MPAAKPKIELVCPTCDTHFFVRPSIAKERRCCSVRCQGLWKKSFRQVNTCANCSETFEVRQSKKDKRFCSRKCWDITFGKMMEGNTHRKGLSSWTKGRYGKDSPAWKGGLKNLNRSRADTTTWEYRQWRTAVFTRDNYTCQICEQYGGVLHADHIKRWADNEDLRYTVSNGRTLCVPCHYYITFKTKMKPGNKWCNYTARERG